MGVVDDAPSLFAVVAGEFGVGISGLYRATLVVLIYHLGAIESSYDITFIISGALSGVLEQVGRGPSLGFSELVMSLERLEPLLPFLKDFIYVVGSMGL